MATLSQVSPSQSPCFLTLQGWHQTFTSNQESGQRIERCITNSSFSIVSLCIYMDFYFHVWTLCAAGPFCLLQYQRELSAWSCASVETEMTVRGYSLEIFLILCRFVNVSASLCVGALSIAFDVTFVAHLFFLSDSGMRFSVFFTRLTRTERFDQHLNNCHKASAERKGHSFTLYTFLLFVLLSCFISHFNSLPLKCGNNPVINRVMEEFGSNIIPRQRSKSQYMSWHFVLSYCRCLVNFIIIKHVSITPSILGPLNVIM